MSEIENIKVYIVNEYDRGDGCHLANHVFKHKEEAFKYVRNKKGVDIILQELPLLENFKEPPCAQ